MYICIWWRVRWYVDHEKVSRDGAGANTDQHSYYKIVYLLKHVKFWTLLVLFFVLRTCLC